MKPWVPLRIAALLTLVHGVLHTAGGVFGPTPPGAEAVAAAMRDVHFTMLGASRSFSDFQRGYGLFVTVTFLVETVVFWQLGSLVKKAGLSARPIMMTFAVGYLLDTVVAWKYFFAPPTVFEVLIAAMLLWAWAVTAAV